MSNEQILKKAIEKAVKNGLDWGIHIKTKKQTINATFELANEYPYHLVFDHSFAKAFWGEKIMGMGGTNTCPEWMYYLQQMVLEENKLKYLEKFL